jgi:hypothetical protein
MITRKARRSGFTVLEMLLAVGLTGVVVGLGSMMATKSSDIWRRQQERAQASRAGWGWVDRVATELRMALPPADLGKTGEFAGSSKKTTLYEALGQKGEWPAETEQRLRMTRLNDDTIRFPTADLRDTLGHEAHGLVQYSLKRDGEGRVLGVARIVTLPGAGEKEVETLESKEIVSLGFQCLNAEGQWLDEWMAADKLPRAVRITVATLAAKDGTDPRVIWFSTLVYLPMAERIPL